MNLLKGENCQRSDMKAQTPFITLTRAMKNFKQKQPSKKKDETNTVQDILIIGLFLILFLVLLLTSVTLMIK